MPTCIECDRWFGDNEVGCRCDECDNKTLKELGAINSECDRLAMELDAERHGHQDTERERGYLAGEVGRWRNEALAARKMFDRARRWSLEVDSMIDREMGEWLSARAKNDGCEGS